MHIFKNMKYINENMSDDMATFQYFFYYHCLHNAGWENKEKHRDRKEMLQQLQMHKSKKKKRFAQGRPQIRVHGKNETKIK